MTALRFHRALYAGEAVDEAVKTFEGHASFERAEEPDYWVIRVQAEPADRERLIADELGNYALGISIRNRGTR
jgi:hypothetical protein